MNDLITKYNNMLNEVNGLSIDDQWSYFKWEWLRRNFNYNSKRDDYGLYQRQIRILEKIRSSSKTDKQKERWKRTEMFFFTMFCGLKEPVCPSSGKWNECDWEVFNDTFFDAVFKQNPDSRYEKQFLHAQEILKNQKNIPYFLRPVSSKFIIPKYGQLELPKVDKEDNPIGYTKKSVNSSDKRLQVEEWCFGLVIYDYIKANQPDVFYDCDSPSEKQKFKEDEAKIQYGSIAELFGESRSKKDTFRKRYDVTKAFIKDSVNTEYLNPFPEEAF